MIDTRKQRLTMQEATNPTPEDAIKYLESMVFPQDMSPSTLRAMAVNRLAIAALQAQIKPRQQWIPVTESLPSVRRYPPVICGHDTDNWTDAAIVTGQGKFINSDGCEIFPTHWTQLPEPPGGERR
jgi:hypothetical protein